MNLRRIIFITCFLLVDVGLEANPVKRTNNFKSYKDPLNEFGYGINAVYFKNENQLAPLLYLYYSRYFTSNFSIGASYCGLYAKSYQNALSAKISFRVLKNLAFSLKPGLYLKNQNDQTELLYFLGFESVYKFKLSDKIGLGPMVGVQLVQGNINLYGGFQMGFYF
jgi:hypothetical protein